MKLSVCIEAVFKGWDFIEGMHAVKEAGICAYEFWRWWDKDIDAIKKAKGKLNLDTAAFCTKFVSLVDPLKREEYIDALRETIDVAKKLDCKNIISQVGDELPGVPRSVQHDCLVQGLKAGIPYLEKEGITLVFEPLNTIVNHKGYYLWSSEEAFGIQDEVGSANVKVLYDIYHQQVMEGHLISRITANIDKIGHFHAAGNPGRNELSTGEINYVEVLKSIKESGYKGFVGLEYFPVGDAAGGLKKLNEWGIVKSETGY